MEQDINWAERARKKHGFLGDKNNKYFQATVTIRKRPNII